jgi:hypothetical protein
LKHLESRDAPTFLMYKMLNFVSLFMRLLLHTS